MAFEIPGLLRLNDGTFRKPKFRIYDERGNQEFDIDRVVWSLKRRRDGAEVLEGDSEDGDDEAMIDNADEDRAGNAIKTVAPVMDLRDTDLEPGSYILSMHLYLSNGEDDVVRQAVQVVEFREVA